MKTMILVIALIFIAHPVVAAVQCNTPLQQASFVAHAPGWVKSSVVNAASIINESSAIANLDAVVIGVRSHLPVDDDEDALAYVKCVVNEYIANAIGKNHVIGIANAKKWLSVR